MTPADATSPRVLLFLLLTSCVVICCCDAAATADRRHDSPGVCADGDVKVTNAYVSYDFKTDAFRIADTEDEQTVAHARYSNCINTTGFSYLSVSTVNAYTYQLNSTVQAYAAGARVRLQPDISLLRSFSYLSVSTVNAYTYQLNSSVQAYAAGLVEGHVTRDLIAMHYNNTVGPFMTYCQNNRQVCDAVQTFARQNVDWLVQNIAENPADSYWYHVRLAYEQLRGMQDGYDGTPELISVQVDDVFGLYLLTMMTDLETVLAKFVDGNSTAFPDIGHCSVLIKVIQGQDGGVKDVLMAHDTWASYGSMLRILKRYDFYLRKTPTASAPAIGSTMTFSSYPGTLGSIDDFYLVASAMMVTETTNHVFNASLFKIVTPQSVFESIRALVACRLGEHGADWGSTFSRYNSGTYNNQWMVVDMKRFDQNQILSGFLTVLEQIPGSIRREDETEALLSASYWASYNIPYYSDISKASGWPAQVEIYGDYYSHKDSPRAQIFRRDHSKVTDVDSMTRLMRYNDYKHDPQSKCMNCKPKYNAFYSISARGDLNLPNGNYPLPETGFALAGGIDMKLTSLNIAMDTLTFMAISGPTFDPLPPFQWSTAINGSQTSHLGMPDIFNFGPVWFNGTFGSN